MRLTRGKPVFAAAILSAAVLLCQLGCSARIVAEREPFDFDLVIRGGTIVDGTGGDPFNGDIGISGDRIAGIGDLGGMRGRIEIDAAGRCVAPGFIDVHSHADYGILDRPGAHNLVRQGITTVVTGNCGSSAWPVGRFFMELGRAEPAINVALLIGHNTIRCEVMGLEARAPSDDEMERMVQMVEIGMREGAAGLSTGLKYAPGVWAGTDEVAALARAASNMGGIYCTHMRDEGRGIIESVREALEIGRRADIPVQISHHKIASVDRWGASEQTLRMVAAARAQGLAVHLDQYPYAATSTQLTVLFPPWSLEGGQEALLDRLAEPGERGRIKRAIVDNILHDRGGSEPARIQIAQCESHPEFEGANIALILEDAGRPVTNEDAAEKIMEIQEAGGAMAIFHCLSDEDIERIMRFEYTMVATDGGVTDRGSGKPHPRNYGTFPRLLRLYVREKGILSLPEAVRRATSLPALAFRLAGRGAIAMDMYADLVVFDPECIADTATWADPHRYPAGIKAVVVNGRLTVLDGEQLEARAGRALLGPGAR